MKTCSHGHEHVVEHDVAVGLVEPARQRIVEGIVGVQRKRPPRDERHPRRIDRDRNAIGVVFVAGLQRMDAAQVDPVRQHAAGRDLLRAGDHDAVVALLDDAGIERRIALLVRRLGAVDLRRHDGVAGVDVVVAHELVERDQVVGELLARGGEQLRRRRVAGEEAGDVIGRPAHQAESRLRPGFREQPPGAQIGVRARDLPGPPHRLTGFRRRKRHALALRRIGRDVIEVCDRPCRLAERRMHGHVLDALAVDENTPAVIERTQVFGAGAHQRATGAS